MILISKTDHFVVVVQSPSPFQLFLTPWAVARQAPLSSTDSWSLLRFVFIELVILIDHLGRHNPHGISQVAQW